MSILKQLAAVSAVALASVAGSADTVTIGRVYDIAEADALAEIKARAGQTDWPAAMSKPRSEWSAYRYAPVGAAVESRTRAHVPYHTVEQPIYAATGELIYPAGYQFNPLEYLTLPRRVVVIGPEHGAWAEANLQATDLVLLAGADNDRLSTQLERPVFILDRRTQQRLDVRLAPSVIEQQGNVFIISEYAVESSDASD